MRVTGIGMTLHGAEGAASPPLPYIELDEGEGDALIALYPGHVVIVADIEAERDAEAERLAVEWAASEEAARIAAQAEYAETERQRIAAQAAFAPGSPAELAGAHHIADRMTVDPEVIDAINGGAPLEVAEGALVQGEPSAADVIAGGGEASTELADAIDLLDPVTGFVKNGARKGRPKVEAVADILGRDVTIDEIDAVFLAKAAAE